MSACKMYKGAPNGGYMPKADIASQPLETQGMSNHSRLEEIFRRIDQHQRIEKSLAGIQTFR